MVRALSSIIALLLCFYSQQSQAESVCFYGNADGRDYDGILDKTASGASCVSWASVPHSSDVTVQNYPCSLGDHSFCRNPNERAKPWCYTHENGSTWELCDMNQCTEYVDNDDSDEYSRKSSLNTLPTLDSRIDPTSTEILALQLNLTHDFGLQSPLMIFSPNASALSVAIQGSVEFASIVAAEQGQGRLISAGDEGLPSGSAPLDAAVYQRLLAWLARVDYDAWQANSTAGPKVATFYGASQLPNINTTVDVVPASILSNTTLFQQLLDDYDVIIPTPNSLSLEQLHQLTNASIHHGVGILLGYTVGYHCSWTGSI